MITDKIIKNKIYMYAGFLHKVKKIQKTKNRALMQNLATSEEIFVPIEQSEIILQRIYTVGEVSKIVERRPDTIRKYERLGLIPKPLKLEVDYPSYRNWRFYTPGDVYEMVEFFSDRSPGRPVKKSNETLDKSIKSLDQRVKMKTASLNTHLK
jgi:DNA-binding transcriptional MerR regulator